MLDLQARWTVGEAQTLPCRTVGVLEPVGQPRGVLLAEAAAANDQDRRATACPCQRGVATRADQLKHDLDAALAARLAGPAAEARKLREMLHAARAGPHAVSQPPKQ